MIESRSIALSNAVKKVFYYYAAFKHPLSLEEVHFNCTEKCSMEEVDWVLNKLLISEEIYSYKNYYTTSKDISKWVKRRNKGEMVANRILPSSLRYGRFIAGFPFVRFVGVSGSLSKGYADKQSDFDFFIVTVNNRLWVCRTLLHIVKKLSFIFGLQNCFCMNYFVDENHCEIEEKNLYTAIELSSLKAVSGSHYYNKLMNENQWIKEFLPNGYQPFFYSDKVHNNNNLFVKKMMEYLLNPLGNQLNLFLMQWTDKKWRKKWKRKKYPMEDYELAFKTTLHHSKNHPANYQKKVLSNMEYLQTSKA